MGASREDLVAIPATVPSSSTAMMAASPEWRSLTRRCSSGSPMPIRANSLSTYPWSGAASLTSPAAVAVSCEVDRIATPASRAAARMSSATASPPVITRMRTPLAMDACWIMRRSPVMINREDGE